MNLDACTPGQQQSIEHVLGPLLVSAGAGSGKTFTLTQRIAYALMPESGPVAASVDEVLAITFTEKAAAEIKARVKRTLRQEGMTEEALKVDAAWISTIHGMCARVLRTHALELGLDPKFGIMGDAEKAELITSCINEALGQDNDIIDRGSYSALFDEFLARSVQPKATSIASMLETLLNKATALRGGLAALDFGPAPESASVLARRLLLAYEEVLPALEQAGASSSAESARDGAADAVAILESFLTQRRNDRTGYKAAEGEDAVKCSVFLDNESHAYLRAFAEALNQCAYVPRTFGNADIKAQVKDFQEVYGHTCRQVVLGMAWPHSVDLLRLAQEVASRYETKKRAVCKLDNDDLLVKTLAAFEDYPLIARRYERRFKLVMVDEFQDTSQLQIDMIARLAGPNCEHLCTVGDAQQSIYRFRGADVNVYEAHKQAMRSPEVGALYIELAKNFRSHGDVLSFVDRIFEQPQVFGESFMSLSPHEARLSCYKGKGPRIDLALSMLPAGKTPGVGAKEVAESSARAIAKRFAALRKSGHTPRDMVVLLGRMTRSEVYAQALRDEGFECAVTGGSLFSQASEVRVISRFVQALANPGNTAALFEVLTSDMIRLSSDDLLELATEEDDETGRVHRRDLHRGFSRLYDKVGSLSPRLDHAVSLFFYAQTELCVRSVAEVVQESVVRSGWMARLQQLGAVGMACAANILKTIRLIERIETEQHRGVASVARALARELNEGIKEAPGALSGSDGNVIKIMTIHASKGLEFPIVALAEFASSGKSSTKLVVETCGTVARASLLADASVGLFSRVTMRAAEKTDKTEVGQEADAAIAQQLLQGTVAPNDAAGKGVCSQDAYRAALCERAGLEELAEARRKLYVGLTRASEALVVAMDSKTPSSGKPPTYAPLVDDIRCALCGVEDFPEGSALLAYGGSEPALFERILLPAKVGYDALSDAPGDTLSHVLSQQVDGESYFVVPRRENNVRVPRCAWPGIRSDVFSYSSISSDKEDGSHLPLDNNARFDGVENPALTTYFSGDEPLNIAQDGQRSFADGDKATGLGSAFHRVAQFAVETGCVPNGERMAAFAKSFLLSSDQEKRLRDACIRWFQSAIFAEVISWPSRRAEVPFYVQVGTEFLEGEIDLLCTKEAGQSGGSALVVDYKTGGNTDETPIHLHKKHLLQAQCYAYALLSSGFEEVELRFVRVEHPQDFRQDEPQVVVYRFSASDCDDLKTHIIAAREKMRSL